MNRYFVLSAAIVSALLISVAPARAQGVAASRVFVGGVGGVTFGDVDRGGSGGVRAGVRIGPGVHIIGEVGKIGDVLPSSARDDIDELLDFIYGEFGESASISIKAPATYGFGGVRWTGAGRVSPFVEVGGGVARISSKFENVTIGGVDLTSTFRQIVTDAEVDSETTSGMLVVSGGISAAVSRLVSIDAGYRFSRIFIEAESAINVSAAQVAVTFGW
jgi:opacity protein-like surface antigen